MTSAAAIIMTIALAGGTAGQHRPTARAEAPTRLAQSREAEKPGKPAGSQHSGGERGTTGMLSDGKGKSAGSNTSPSSAATKAPRTGDAGATSESQGTSPRRGAPSGPPGRRGGIPRGSGDVATQNTDRASQSATAEDTSGGPRLPPDTRGKAKASPDGGAVAR